MHVRKAKAGQTTTKKTLWVMSETSWDNKSAVLALAQIFGVHASLSTVIKANGRHTSQKTNKKTLNCYQIMLRQQKSSSLAQTSGVHASSRACSH